MSARLLPPLSVTVSVHVHADTPMRVVLHPEQDRAVVTLGDTPGCPTLDLYARRAELVALRDTLTAAVADLDAARRESTGEPGGTRPDEVRDPAA